MVDQCQTQNPDLIITDIRMPELDGIDAVNKLTTPRPVILVSAYHDAEFVERARHDHILAYLIKPIKAVDLEPAIALAMQRFAEFQALQHETDNLRHALEVHRCKNDFIDDINPAKIGIEFETVEHFDSVIYHHQVA